MKWLNNIYVSEENVLLFKNIEYIFLNIYIYIYIYILIYVYKIFYIYIYISLFYIALLAFSEFQRFGFGVHVWELERIQGNFTECIMTVSKVLCITS